MDTLSNLIGGFSTALSPTALLYCAIGVLLGTAVGVLPGIGPALTIALLLPVTRDLDVTNAFIMFAGVYYGAMYGGSTTSILLNTPGESASVITSLEGFQMARRGRGGAALATAAIGSFVAGTISTVAITVVGPAAGRLATVFQPADYVALTVLSFTTVASLVGRSAIRGLTSLFLGLLLGVIGIDQLSGSARLTFERLFLLDGIDVVVVAVGLFAVGETLHVAWQLGNGEDRIIPVEGKLWLTREEWRRSWKPWLRGTAIGFPLGTLPAGGAEVPTFLSYSIEKRLARNPEEFGNGAIEGVAGPEAANNASFTGVLVPLLTLGLPTSATAAIMLSAFQSYNVQPGPQLFERQGTLLWALIASLYIGNVMLVVLNLPLVRVWVKLLTVPRPLLYGSILTFAMLGVFAASSNTADMYVMIAIGVIGFLMRRYDFPIGPMIVGLILGPVAESQFRRTMSISQGDPTVFLRRPLSLSILIVALLAALVPVAPSLISRLSGRGARNRIVFGGDED